MSSFRDRKLLARPAAPLTSTGNQAADDFVDLIVERLYERLIAAQQGDKGRWMGVPAAAEYIGRSPSAVRHLIAKRAIPSVRRDGRVQFDRQDLDNWLELGKTRL
jgi:excisionase family DNA binding protein